MPPGRSPMPRDTTSALSGLASFAKLQALLAARRHEGCAEGKMTFEAFAVALGHAVRGLENALKAADLARYDVDTNAVMVDGQEWRKCLEQQPKTYLSASGPITVARNLYRPADGGKCLCPLELRAGIIGGLDTPVLARQVTSLMGPLTVTVQVVKTYRLRSYLRMAYPAAMETRPALSHEVWEQTPPKAQAYIPPLEARVATLEGMMQALQDQLHQTSRNSSRPPSSDPPQSERPRRPRSTRRRGGQPGHPG